MESLGDILRRIREGVSGGSPEEGSSVPDPEPGPSCGVCGGSGFVSLRVSLSDPRFGQAQPCPGCRPVSGSSPDPFLRYSNLGGLSGLSFDSSSPGGISGDPAARDLFAAALSRCREYAESPEGWLVLSGPPGSGKTHLAACVVNRRIELREPGFFLTCSDLLDHLRSAYAPGSEVTFDQLLDKVRTAPLLVLDDLGGHNGTPWAEERLLQVINHRYVARLPTVFTVGVPLERLPNPSIRVRLSGVGGLSEVLSLGRFDLARWSGIGDVHSEMLRRMTFDSFDLSGTGVTPRELESLRSAWAASRSYASSPEGWLLLSGVRGSGKTHLAVSVAGECLSRGMRVLFVFVPSLLAHLRSAFSPGSPAGYDEVFGYLVEVPLLVLDDLGAERNTSRSEERLYQLVSLRHSARLPTVLTTSLTMSELEESRPGIHSRLLDPSLVGHEVILAPHYHSRCP